jgi:hypothetical protein
MTKPNSVATRTAVPTGTAAASRPPAADPAADPICAAVRKYWLQHREASLNWLALGLLLAAWNASDDGAGKSVRRPDSLRGYESVSVRAAHRMARDR